MKRDTAPFLIDENLSRQFATMSFVSALMIVYLHTGTATQEECLAKSLHVLIRSLCAIAIPWFFFASGFFVAGHINECGWYKREIAKRVRSLLVPFWMWGGIICLSWCFVALLIRFMGYSFQGIDAFEWISLRGVATILGLNPVGNIPTMWFLRALFILVALSPLLLFSKWVILIVTILYLGWTVLCARMDSDARYIGEYLVSMRGLMYFTLGGFARYYWRKEKSVSEITICMIGALFLCVSWVTDGVLSSLGFALALPFIMWEFFCLCRYVRLPSAVTAQSFPVYLIHGTIAYFLQGAFALIGFGHGRTPFLIGISTWLLAVVLSLATAMLIRRLMPAIAKVLFGGR